MPETSVTEVEYAEKTVMGKKHKNWTWKEWQNLL